MPIKYIFYISNYFNKNNKRCIQCLFKVNLHKLSCCKIFFYLKNSSLDHYI